MGLLPDTESCGLRMRQECRERFSRRCGLTIPTCITACAWRTCRDACRDRYLAVSSEVSGGQNVASIPSAYATCNFPYLVRGPLHRIIKTQWKPMKYLPGALMPLMFNTTMRKMLAFRVIAILISWRQIKMTFYLKGSITWLLSGIHSSI